MLLEIVKYPEPILKAVAKPVEVFDSDLEKLIKNMFETMYAAPGVGLAAPQVGISKQVIVVDVSERSQNKEKFHFINPEVVSSSGKEKDEEGCLSIPGYRALVERPTEITIKYQDLKGKNLELKAQGLLARCIQHEIDHINGILFVDRLSRLKKENFKRWYKKNEPI